MRIGWKSLELLLVHVVGQNFNFLFQNCCLTLQLLPEIMFLYVCAVLQKTFSLFRELQFLEFCYTMNNLAMNMEVKVLDMNDH